MTVNNNITFVKELPSYKWRNKNIRMAMYKCYCGNEFITRVNSVKMGKTKSCGCLHKLNSVTHGLRYEKEYTIWKHIKSRCCNKNNKSYKDYGGRGIKMADYWLSNPESFITYIRTLDNFDVEGLTLDRIENDRNYEIGNLRWANRHIQATNKRMNIIGASKYVGVSKKKWRKNIKWCARITVNGKRHNLGYHNCDTSAVMARDRFILDNKLTEYKVQLLKTA